MKVSINRTPSQLTTLVVIADTRCFKVKMIFLVNEELKKL